MRPTGEKGLTLVELLITLTIMGIIAVAAMPLLSTCLEAHSQGTDRSGLYQEGLLAMERMTGGIRRCNYLLIPNAHNITRDILAVSGLVNQYNEYYFGDPLFPRIDADFTSDMNDDSSNGIQGIDDDGDGQVDEGSNDDDDEDGSLDDSGLCPVIYSFDSATNALKETSKFDGTTTVLSNHITQFQVTYEAPDATHGPRVQVALTLTGGDGESIQFVEYAYPRNSLQKTGKRVR